MEIIMTKLASKSMGYLAIAIGTASVFVGGTAAIAGDGQTEQLAVETRLLSDDLFSRFEGLAGWGVAVQAQRIVHSAGEPLRASAMVWNQTTVDARRIFPSTGSTVGCQLDWWVTDGHGVTAIRAPGTTCGAAQSVHVLRSASVVSIPLSISLEYANSELGLEGPLDPGIYRLNVRWLDSSGPVPDSGPSYSSGHGYPGATIDFLVE